jgi:hypothetical protein
MGPELTLMFVVLFGLAGTCWTVMVLIAWLRHRRLPRSIGGLAIASTAVVMITLNTAEPEYGVLRRLSESGSPRRAPEAGRAEPPPEYRGRRWAPEYRRPSWTAEQTAAEQARVDEMHRRFAPTLEQYRTARGTYPPTLAMAGIETPMTRYGPLYYYSSGSKRDPWYLISFGDIETHLFSADWDSRTQQWTVTSYSD